MSGSPPSTESQAKKPQSIYESYEILCICGQTLTGDRDLSPQLVECPQCRWEWFILPKSPYPAPSDEKEKRRKRKLRDKRRKEFLRNLVLSPVYAVQFIYKLGLQSCQLAWSNLVLVLRGVVRFFTPFRIVVTFISIFLVITLVVMVNNSRLSSALKTLRDEAQLGQAALTKRDLTQAAVHYDKAQQALDFISLKEPYHLDIEYFSKETFALTHMVQDDLISIARSSQETSAKGSRSEWEAMFRYRYRSKWIILDITLPPGLEKLTDNYYHPIWVDQQVIFLEMPLDILPVSSSSSAKVRLILAGELASMEEFDHPFSASVGCWKITFEKSSLFLWAHESTASYLSFEDGPWLQTESIKDTLARQRNTIGITVNSPAALEPKSTTP